MFFSELHEDTLDVSIDFYGYEDCSPAYSFGPAIRDNYVLHYISKGKGSLHYKQQIIHLQAGDLFLLQPNEVTFYQADQKDPWSYYWIGLSGDKVGDYFRLSRLSELSYFHQEREGSTRRIGKLITSLLTNAESKEHSTLNHLELLSQAYLLLFELARLAPQQETKERSQIEELCQECRRIIQKHYNLDTLSIVTIAKDLMINRSHLTTSFKKLYQVSPKDYLLQTRMQRAKQLLESTNEPIKVIAYSVGYRDPLHFSKAFKDFFQLAPSHYRKQEKRDSS